MNFSDHAVSILKMQLLNKFDLNIDLIIIKPNITNINKYRPDKIDTNQIKHQMKKEAKLQIVPLIISIIATGFHELTDEKAVQLSLPSHAVKNNRLFNRFKRNLIPLVNL